MPTTETILQQVPPLRPYVWVCDCGHTYTTVENVPGKCPLHMVAPDLLAVLEELNEYARGGGMMSASHVYRVTREAIEKARPS